MSIQEVACNLRRLQYVSQVEIVELDGRSVVKAVLESLWSTDKQPRYYTRYYTRYYDQHGQMLELNETS